MRAIQGTGRPKLAYIFTSSLSLTFILDSIPHFVRSGFDLCVISSSGVELRSASLAGAETFAVEMRRNPAPIQDLRCIWQLWRVLRRSAPDLTNVGTPKAGLLGGIAALLARIPNRIYTIHGLRLETTKGPKRWLLWCTEWVSCRCAHEVLCVSASVCNRVRQLRLVSREKSMVLGRGSIGGIDVEKYSTSRSEDETAMRLRLELGIHSDALVVGFVGRLVRDKGIQELYHAFRSVASTFPSARLLLVGGFEEGDPLSPQLRSALEHDPMVVNVGWSADVLPFYRMMDVFAFPTHREGLGTVLLEAQAFEIPVAATHATGVGDAMMENVTGLLTPVGDAEALARTIHQLLSSPELRRRMGKAGRSFVEENFASTDVIKRLENEYRRMLNLAPSIEDDVARESTT